MSTLCDTPMTELEDPEVLCSVLGHELRNPLAAALASVQVVEAMTDAEDPRTEFLVRAFTDLQRLRASLDALLCLGSKQLPAFSEIDLGEVVDRVIERRIEGDRTGPHRIRLGCEPSGASSTVMGDRSLIDRAVENLIENSFRAGAQSVELHLERAGDTVSLRILDDGRGLPAGPVEPLFSAFRSGCGGSGLGLAVVRSTMIAHGGSVELRNRSDRPGAEAVLSWPAPGTRPANS